MERTVQDVGKRRIFVSVLLLALVVVTGIFSWSIPVLRHAEAILYDLRASITSPIAQIDDRIVILTYDQKTVYNSGKHSPLDREIMTDALMKLQRLNPKSIGIDIIYDQKTEADDQLINALNAMTIPVSIAFVNDEPKDAFAWRQVRDQALAFERQFHRRITNSRVSKARALLQWGDLGVVRQWPIVEPNGRDLMAVSLAGADDGAQYYGGPVVFGAGSNQDGTGTFLKLSLSEFLHQVNEEALKGYISGKHVLIGQDVPGIDKFNTPQSSVLFEDPMAGVEVHAHMLAQILNGDRPTSIPSIMIILSCITVIGLAAYSAFSDFSPARQSVFIVVQFLAVLTLPFLLHHSKFDTLAIPAFGWMTSWSLGFMVFTGLAKSIGEEKRLFAQGALGKYLPDKIANEILSDPEKLNLNGERREIFALFSDLEGFTKLSHAIEPETLASLLNSYLQLLTDTVLAHGGTIDKFVGDAVVAFWGAPITHPDDADRAARCAIAMWKAGEEFRNSVPDSIPPIGMTRVGLHFGDAVVGNFGGNGRLQYTALGDAMNTAARLESANKKTGTGVLVSGQVREKLEGLSFRTLGRVNLSGRSTAIEIFQPVDPSMASQTKWLNNKFVEFDKGDLSARDEIVEFARASPDDIALSAFADRLSTIKPGESYEFASK